MDNIEANRAGNLTTYLTKDDVIILDKEGRCVASSSMEKVGEIFKFPPKKLARTNLKINGEISHFELVYQKERYRGSHLALIKKLAEATLATYINTIARPLTSIDQFFANLLEQPFRKDKLDDYKREAQSLGINLELERVAIVLELEKFTRDNLPTSDHEQTHEDLIQEWKNRIIETINGFFTLKTDIFVAYVGQGRFVVYKEVNSNQEKFIKYMKTAYSSIFYPLLSQVNGNLTVGFSDSHSGLEGLVEAYQEASQALVLANKFSSGRNQSYYYGDLGTMRILTEENVEKKRSLAKNLLEPLEKETLRQTLETFLNEDMDIKVTARKMKIHPNTVNYRLAKIAESLGLDPRVFRQAFELRIALLTDKLFE